MDLPVWFEIGDLLDRLRYLHYGIAFILAFIGMKLVFHAMHENELPFINGGHHIEWAPEISTLMSDERHRRRGEERSGRLVGCRRARHSAPPCPRLSSPPASESGGPHDHA